MFRALPTAALALAALLCGGHGCTARAAEPAAAEEGLSAGQFETTPGPLSPDGVRATIDLPAGQHLRNTGGSDGAGLCVPTSATHSARWQGVDALDGFVEWLRTRPGGSYPEKFAADLAEFCRLKGRPVPDYVQHTGGDERVLELALKTGRMPAGTYSGLDNLYRTRVAHMVNPVHLDATRAAIVDNNRPGNWVWMPRATYLSRWRDMNGGWLIVFLAAPPPPYPVTPPRINPASQIGQPAAPAPAAAPDGYRWEGPFNSTEWGAWHRLTKDGRAVGALEKGGWHRCLNPDGKGDTYATAPAGAPPCPGPAEAAPAGRTNFGVDLGRLHAGRRYYRRGVEVSFGEVYAALELTDDADKWNLTAVGSDAQGWADAIPAAARAKFHVRAYPAGHWAVSQFSLRPGLTVRKPAVARVGADAAFLGPLDYAADKLAPFLDAALSGKPFPPPAPAPLPAPSPSPAPPAPPAPADPADADGPWCLLLAVLLPAALFLALRRPRQ